MVDLMVSEQQSGTAGKGVHAGFKMTEVGIIPEDWEVKPIGQLNPFITSGSRGWADFYAEYGDLFVRITNMSRNSIYLDTKTCENKFVSLPATSTEGKRTQLNDSDILISITADIGIIGYIDESIAKPAYINQHISLVRFDDDSIDNKFVAYFLASEHVQKKFLANSDLGAKAGMNLNGVRSITFAIPTKQEQSAIAEALTDVDILIVKLKKILTKKQAIKTATMQQLLTGKTRLPLFALREDGVAKGYKKSELGDIPVDWDISTYGQVFSFLSTSTNARSDLSDTGEYGYIHYGDIHTKWNNNLNLENSPFPRISSDLVSSSFIEDGDLIMADASEDYAGIGKSIEIQGVRDNKIVSGLHTYLLRDVNNIFVDGFRGYLHCIRTVKANIDRLATGMKVFGVSKNNLKTIPIPVLQKKNKPPSPPSSPIWTRTFRLCNSVWTKSANLNRG